MRPELLTRANPQIWRLAEWLYNNHPPTHEGDQDYFWDESKEDWYDMAATLLKKIENREFTNGDNHE